MRLTLNELPKEKNYEAMRLTLNELPMILFFWKMLLNELQRNMQSSYHFTKTSCTVNKLSHIKIIEWSMRALHSK